MVDSFNGRVTGAIDGTLRAIGVETIQVNLGLRCNQQCRHCHAGGGPNRSELMGRDVMESVAEMAATAAGVIVDITGGAPELNLDFRWFVRQLRSKGVGVRVRTNLTVLLEASFVPHATVKVVAVRPTT